jgi:hypothetical protein
MLRRPRRAFPHNVLVNAGTMNEVARANQLQASGHPEQAALLFMEQARQMQQIGRPRQAANLHALAAHAWVNAGVEQRAMNQAGRAFQIFARQGMWQRAAEFKTNLMQHLREYGMQGSADNIERAYDTARIVTVPRTEEPIRAKLPAACPHCGAPIRSDVVEWVDESSAECGFCGGIIKAE